MEIWKQFFAHDYYELCRKTRDDLKARAARSTESSDYELIRESMMSSDYETEIMTTSDFEEEEEESEISSEVSGWDEEWGFRSGGSADEEGTWTRMRRNQKDLDEDAEEPRGSGY